MLITLACAAMTIIFFIVSQVSGPCEVRVRMSLERRFYSAQKILQSYWERSREPLMLAAEQAMFSRLHSGSCHYLARSGLNFPFSTGGEEQLLSKLTACSHIEEHLFHLLQRINFSSPVAEHQQASINFSWSLSSISIDPFIGHQPFFLIILLPLKHQMKFKSPLISTGYFQNSTFCSASKS